MNQTRQPLMLFTIDLQEINRMLDIIQDLLDERNGLRGPLDTWDQETIHGSIVYKDGQGHVVHGFGGITSATLV